ncbi:leucine-rich repeat-containing protein 4B-like [Homarus americanus]|uniref:leucine-rich repeat-containing protein 4B-like n=1 Tax=Homarus americanus TaxID=6706 RepID=UPI001C469010|nr:leucine-rich repeat-containing protein 4B-like [Homarus americanus]
MVVWWLAWAYLLDLAQAFCPPGCSCDDAAPSASCVGMSLNVVPILFNPGLCRLNLAHNSISSIDEAFVFLDKLQELDLSHNLLISVRTGNFKMQSGLLELRLAHNNITSFTSGAFRGLVALRTLDLNHNSLPDLPVGVLDDLPQLTVLHLAHNRLHILTQRTFRGLRGLLLLDLCDNYFRHVPTTAFEDLTSLQTLHLCRNRLTRLDPLAFPTDTLTSLTLDTNNIDSLDKRAFLRLQQLQELRLDCNTLHEVPTEALSLLVTLDFLSLSRNKIKTIGPNAFRGLGRLSTLEISRSPHLESVHPEALDGCRGLQTLTISHNPLLRHLPAGLLTSLHSLRSVDLRANGLQSFPEAEVPWSSLRKMDLRDNPLVCNCSLQWLAELLGSSNTSLAAPDLQCAAPDKLQGLYLSRLVPSEQLCGERVQVLVGLVVITASTVLILTLSLLLCRYWRRQQRAKLGSGWPPDPLGAPWPPQGRPLPNRHIMAEEYVYHTPASITKVPVTKV